MSKGLGDFIRSHRKKEGLTQKSLGEKLNKGESTVRMWELGKSTPPADVIPLLSKVLKTNYIQLMQLAGYIAEADSIGLQLKRDLLIAKQKSYRDSLQEIVSKIKENEFKLNKFLYMKDDELTDDELKQRSSLITERSELKDQSEELRYTIEDLQVEIDELNDFIRNVLEYKYKEEIQSPIAPKELGKTNGVIEIDKLLNTTQKISIYGKVLSQEEKERALQILKLTFGNSENKS